MSLTTDAKERKATPVYSGFVKYFPQAMAAVAVLSAAGNEQHNPGKPLHWDRSKSGDELDAAMRHLLEAGTIDTDGIRHSAKLAWRAMANLEKELERAAKEKLEADTKAEAAKAAKFNDYIDAYSRVLRSQVDAMVTSTLGETAALKPGGIYPYVDYNYKSKVVWPAVKYEGNPFSIVPGPCDYT